MAFLENDPSQNLSMSDTSHDSEPPPYRRPDFGLLEGQGINASLSRENWSGYSELKGVVPSGCRYFPIIKLWGSNSTLFLHTGDQFGDVVFVGAVCTDEDDVMPNSIVVMTTENFEVHYPFVDLNAAKLDDNYGYDAPPQEHFSTMTTTDFLLLIVNYHQITLMPNLQTLRNSVLRTLRLLKGQMPSVEGQCYVRNLFGISTPSPGLDQAANDSDIESNVADGLPGDSDDDDDPSSSRSEAAPPKPDVNVTVPESPVKDRRSGRLATHTSVSNFIPGPTVTAAATTNQVPLGAVNVNAQQKRKSESTSAAGTGSTGNQNKRATGKQPGPAKTATTTRNPTAQQNLKRNLPVKPTAAEKRAAKAAETRTAKLNLNAQAGANVQASTKPPAVPPAQLQTPANTLPPASSSIPFDRNEYRVNQLKDFNLIDYAANKYVDFYARISE
jgi:hypothetical protein